MTICKDCLTAGITTERPAIYPGPRCATHHRYEKIRRSARAYELKLASTYDITEAEYQKLYVSQGGVCFICRVATGKAKRLSVEHEHNMEGCTHLPNHGCRRCIRGLACGRCNHLIAFLGVEALARAVQFLTDPPARKILNRSILHVEERSDEW